MTLLCRQTQGAPRRSSAQRLRRSTTNFQPTHLWRQEMGFSRHRTTALGIPALARGLALASPLVMASVPQRSPCLGSQEISRVEGFSR